MRKASAKHKGSTQQQDVEFSTPDISPVLEISKRKKSFLTNPHNMKSNLIIIKRQTKK